MYRRETRVKVKHAACGHWWCWKMPTAARLVGYYAAILRLGSGGGSLCPKCLAAATRLDVAREILVELEGGRAVQPGRLNAGGHWRRPRTTRAEA